MSDPADLFLPRSLWDDEAQWNDDLTWNDAAFVPGLLPQNATPAEVALDEATARVGDVPSPLRELWDPDTCPASLLPWLAWALSVDNWDPAAPEGVKREVIRQSVALHRRKGTVSAIRGALLSAGYGDATIVERFGIPHDGSETFDGSITYEAPDHWAEYRLTLARPITIAQADKVRAILARVAPLRCHLKLLDFTSVPFTHNAEISFGGAHSYGAA